MNKEYGQVPGSCEHHNELPEFQNMQGVYWLAEELAAFEEGLCSVELLKQTGHK